MVNFVSVSHVGVLSIIEFSVQSAISKIQSWTSDLKRSIYSLSKFCWHQSYVWYVKIEIPRFTDLILEEDTFSYGLKLF